MNIILVSDFAYVDGGASKVALHSAQAMAERGHSVLLFTAVGPIDAGLLKVPGLEVVCLGQMDVLHNPRPAQAALQGIWNGRAAQHFAQILTRFSPANTVVHVHTWTKAISASVIREASKLHFPTVLTLHDYFSACPNGGFFVYPTQQVCRLRPMSVACMATQCDSRSYAHKAWRLARHWVQKEAGGMPDSIDSFISISDTSEAILRPYLPPGSRPYRVLNPIDVKREAPADPAASERFVYVGRLSPEKGPALLASCAANGNFDVTFVGDGPEQQRLRNLATRADFTGWLASSEVAATLRTARALIFPSLWYETQGMAVAEAAALGVPAIVSSQTAAREWIEDGATGLLFEHGSVDDLQKKMEMLRNDPKLARQMGRRAYERYWLHPSTTELHCAALESVYADTLACRARAGVATQEGTAVQP